MQVTFTILSVYKHFKKYIFSFVIIINIKYPYIDKSPGYFEMRKILKKRLNRGAITPRVAVTIDMDFGGTIMKTFCYEPVIIYSIGKL